MRHTILFVFPFSLWLLSADVWADNTVQRTLEAAVVNELRPNSDRVRDKNRMPVDTLKFFGFDHRMNVMDLNPGSGYYVHILAHALRDSGMLYVAINTEHTEKNVLKHDAYRHVKVRSKKTTMRRPEGSRYYTLDDIDLEETNLDMVTNFRSYHNYSKYDRSKLNEAVFASLKPGGIYAVIDHTRRHMEPDSEENRRRIDPVLAIQEIQSTGFQFIDHSTLHFRERDDLTLEVGHSAVTGKTDRWALKFRKPEALTEAR